jgi:ribosomal protein S18 acetylase RimI-like enzyme
MLVKRAGQVAGFAITGPRRDDPAQLVNGELKAIYLHPDHWGSGAATMLYREAMAQLTALGVASAVLWVVRGNDRAVAFYLRHGWRADAVSVVRDDRTGGTYVLDRYSIGLPTVN